MRVCVCATATARTVTPKREAAHTDTNTCMRDEGVAFNIIRQQRCSERRERERERVRERMTCNALRVQAQAEPGKVKELQTAAQWYKNVLFAFHLFNSILTK